MENHRVTVENLVKQYMGKKVVNNLSFSLPSGYILGVVGPNGAGKSTLIRSITGEIPFDNGEIWINEYSIKKQPYEAKAQFGYVPQETTIYPYLTMLEYLKFMAALRNVHDTKIIDHWLVLFDLKEDANKLLKNFSYGMTRKVQIIAAMLGKPSLLLFDEALNGLDMTTLQRVKHLLDDYISKGRSVILISHQTDIIKELSTALLLMKDGVCLEYMDTPRWNSVKHHFEKYYQQQLEKLEKKEE